MPGEEGSLLANTRPKTKGTKTDSIQRRVFIELRAVAIRPEAAMQLLLSGYRLRHLRSVYPCASGSPEVSQLSGA